MPDQDLEPIYRDPDPQYWLVVLWLHQRSHSQLFLFRTKTGELLSCGWGADGQTGTPVLHLQTIVSLNQRRHQGKDYILDKLILSIINVKNKYNKVVKIVKILLITSFS